MNQTIKYGVFAGIATILYYLLFYVSDKNLIFKPFIIWSSLFINVSLMYFIGKKIFSAGSKFHIVLRNVFLIWVISELMFYIWYFRFFNADPLLAQLQTKTMVEGYQYLITQTQDIEQLKVLRDSITDLQMHPLTFTIKDAFLGLGRALVGGFGLAYLITYVLSRKYE